MSFFKQKDTAPDPDEMFAIDDSEFGTIMKSQAEVEKGTNPQTINPGTCICEILNEELPGDILQRSESKKSYELAPNFDNRKYNYLRNMFNISGSHINHYNNLLRDALDRLEKKGCKSESLQKKTSELQLFVSEQINELVKCCSNFRNTLSNNNDSQDVINDRIEEFKETINGTNAEVTNKILEFNKTLNEEDQYYLMPRTKTTNDDQNGIRRTNPYDYCIDDIKIDEEQFEKLEEMFQFANLDNLNLYVRGVFNANNKDDSTNKVTHIYDIRLFNKRMLTLSDYVRHQLINELKGYHFNGGYFDEYDNSNQKLDGFCKKLTKLKDILCFTKKIADTGMQRTMLFLKKNNHLNNNQKIQELVKRKYEHIYYNISLCSNTIFDKFSEQINRISEEMSQSKNGKKNLFLRRIKNSIDLIKQNAEQGKQNVWQSSFNTKNIKNIPLIGIFSLESANIVNNYKY